MRLNVPALLFSLFLLTACQPVKASENERVLATLLARRSAVTRVAIQTPSPTSIVLERPSPTVALPPTAPPAGKTWQWQPVGQVPEQYAADVYYTGNQLIWTEKVWRSQTAATYMQYAQKGQVKEVLRESPAGWKIQSARVANGRLAMVETAEDQPPRVLLYDLAAGTTQTIGARDGQFDSPQRPPKIALDDHSLAWVAHKPDGRTCLRLYDLTGESLTDLFCTERVTDSLEVNELRWPVVTYWRTIEGEGIHYRSPGIYSQVGPLDNYRCDGSQPASSGVTLGCLGKSPDANSAVPYRKAQPGSRVLADSPLAFDETLQVCAGRAIWLPDQAQIHSWAPGTGEEIIYRSSDEAEQIQTIRCTDGWITALIANTASTERRLAVWAAPIP